MRSPRWHSGPCGGLRLSTQDAALEAALIARLLFDPDNIAALKVSPGDFASPEWGTVYGEMLALTSEHRAVDVSILGQRCPGVDFRQLMDQISPAHRAPAEELADEVRGMAERRRLVASLERVIRRAQDSDTQTVLSDLSAAVTKALAGSGGGRLVSPSEAVEHYLADAGSSAAAGLTWAPQRLNHVLQPARGGEMVVVAARPSVGKTVVCEMVVEHWARESQKPVLFASLEMGVSKLMARAARRAGTELPPPSLVWYLDDPRATTASIRAAVSKVLLQGKGLGGIAVDYIGLLKDRQGGDNENLRIAQISSELKALAREHDVPVLALSQLNRSSVRREDPLPRLDDIRDSGAVEQDADIVLGLHREIGSRFMQIKVLKNRDGAAGHTALLDFDEDTVSLS